MVNTLKTNAQITVYGIPNCDTTQKAITWLKKRKINFVFHNYREAGITAGKLNEWSRLAGWGKIFNKKSATWRSLTPRQQAMVTSQKAGVQVMLTHHSIIKRPVIEYNNKIIAGYNEALYEHEFR
ncbi:Spx/MgsR family RNA polymerase-binding regulatory protein [Agriterribacter sp.]|uniref:Spx/MgsR family RNA polymerase-binding regulatory protein n=1 Tax=Agriterribacter sp. TaxID=2821509 RepID=UPI002BB631C2|nr:Spx/MgsR family RNA polymerase-binding regulatory protein [Agriterribacter sp.]HRP56026.1 Spx/MgsR family RNA polymerase-binding regulatory protein [Agriterribacter sp.]